MRQPDLCDGCFQPLPDEPPWIGVDVYEVPLDDDDDDYNPVDDETYTLRVCGWPCLWVYAGRQVEELPSVPLD